MPLVDQALENLTRFAGEHQHMLRVAGLAAMGAAAGLGLADLLLPAKKRPPATRLEQPAADPLNAALGRVDAELQTASVSLSSLARRMGMSIERARALVDERMRADPSLHMVEHEGEMLLFRQVIPAAARGSRWLGRFWRRWRRSDKPQRIVELAASRAILCAQLAAIRQSQEELLRTYEQKHEQAMRLESAAARRARVSELLMIQKDMDRLALREKVIVQQLETAKAHVFNLTMAQQGDGSDVPHSEEIAGGAADAESVVSVLDEEAHLAAELQVKADTPFDHEIEEMMRQLEGRESPAVKAAVTKAPEETSEPEPARLIASDEEGPDDDPRPQRPMAQAA